MALLFTYVVIVIVGQSLSVTVGMLVDTYHSSYAGLMVFVALYFFVFWAAWRLSVWLTEPKSIA